MSDFDQDVREKKSLARSARYRKKGSKSRKCPLPSDNLTNKQLQEMNGEIMTYRMNEPMSWKEFKSIPKHIQIEYVNNLIHKFNVDMKNLAKMFEISTTTVRNYLSSYCPEITILKGSRMRDDECEKWETFLDTNHEECAQSELACGGDGCKCSTQAMNMYKFTLSFSGKVDPMAIANSIYFITGSDAVGEVEIVCKLHS